ncbi:type II RES/Xre toxin-antitoxin system antitoxin [Marinimicrobium sp. C2-29]|uniref:type II RES/Xre toxin-antitoxin system antitoxin n=1 Tax=Marinimicrobium sp. C2-29 TaxID=3139825 RepID=UPI0031398020
MNDKRITRGPVSFQGRVATSITGIQPGDPRKTLKFIRHGLKVEAMEELRLALDASQKELSFLLSMSASTLYRRKAKGVLRAEESDRVVRFALILDDAILLMQEDHDAALAWLRTPLDILGDETPLEHATTEFGAEEVKNLIGRLRNGVFS